MAGMRDKLIHDYFNYDYFNTDVEILWLTIQEYIPTLRDMILGVLQDMQDA